MFADIAWAMAGPQSGGQSSGGSDIYSTLFLIGTLVLIMYFFMIRPQSKKAREQQRMLDGLKRGDRVITTGGIHGKIFSIQDNIVNLEIADKVRIKINKSAIAGAIADQAAKEDKETEDKND